MAFFSNIFKKQAPATPEQRIQALANQSQEQLLTTINTETDDSVKAAAIKRLDFCQALYNWATTDSALESAARKRIGELLDSGAVSVQLLNEKTQDQALLLTLCGYSSSAGDALIQEISEESTLLALGQASGSPSIRKAVAEKLTSQEALRQFQKVVKAKDKAAYKIVKAKLEVFKQQRAEQAALDEQGSALCTQAQQLVKRELDDIYYARRQQIESAWNDLGNISDESITQAYVQAIAALAQKEQAHQKALDDAAAQKAAEIAAKKEVIEGLDAIKKLFSGIFHQDNIESDDETLATLKSQQNAAVESAKARGLDTGPEEKQYTEFAENVAALITKVQTHGNLRELINNLESREQTVVDKSAKGVQSIIHHAKAFSEDEIPEIVQEAKDKLHQVQALAKEKAERIKQLTDDSYHLVRRGFGAVNSGQARRARGVFKELEEKVEQFGADLPTHLEGKYDELKEAVNKLGDWHEFAVTPKKEALLEKMSGLVDSALHPRDLSDRIKGLQEEWKTLSKGGKHDDSSLWEQFQEAANKAYAPCKTYFDEQSAERAQNSAHRKTLIEQLQTYLDQYDWDNANWKEVEKTLRTAREAWQSYWPVARKDNKPLQETFDKVADQIYAKLNAEYDRNKVKKQAIVDQAEKLATVEDLFEATETAKKLQSQWQATGRAKAKDDQALWKAFRAACDAVFEKRKEQSDAAREARNATRLEAERILGALDQILTLNGADFFAKRQEIETLQGHYRALEDLPRESEKSLQQRFQNLNKQLDKKALAEKNLAKAQVWLGVLAAHKVVCDAERQGTPHEAAQQALEAPIKWPGTTLSVLSQRLSNPKPVEDETKALKALHLICIRSEIANDLETPGADKTLRMEYQVQQLQQGLGADTPLFEPLLEEWVAIAAVDPSDYAALESRFLSCWNLSVASQEQEAVESE